MPFYFAKGQRVEKRGEIIAQDAMRLDVALTKHLSISRNQVEKLIKEGLVSVDEKTVRKPGFKLKGGERIAYTFKEAEPSEAAKVDFDVPVLYEDEHLLVINKPAGLVVHPAPSVKEATLVDWLKHKGVRLSTVSGEERHGIVHRIDKETTGALVVAKSNEAHEALASQLQDKSMGRYYLAIIDHPLREDVTVEAPIGRNPKNRLKMAVVEGGKPARTDFVKLAQCSRGTELVAARLHTGRTHQIRVHLGRLGRHILGDDLYGFKSKTSKIARVYLHAYLLYLIHPVSGERLEIVAPLYEDMQHYLDACFHVDVYEDVLHPDKLKARFTS
jgi:23S rRNA pseudouridine1911/1915/1917 synthase